MQKLFWLVVGVAIGAYAAHQFSKTPQGRDFFAGLDDRTEGFTSAVVDGYKAREAELRSAVRDAEDAIADITKRLK